MQGSWHCGFSLRLVHNTAMFPDASADACTLTVCNATTAGLQGHSTSLTAPRHSSPQPVARRQAASPCAGQLAHHVLSQAHTRSECPLRHLESNNHAP